MLIEASGLAEALELMRARSDRVKALGPALQFFGEDIVTKTDTHFKAQTNWDGTAFAPLKPSTVLSRLNSVKGANKYTASSVKKVNAARAAVRGASGADKSAMRAKLIAEGWSGKQAGAIVNFAHAHELDDSGRYSRVTRKLTKSAAAKRAQLLAPGGIVPLIDTARARNSNHIDPPGQTSVVWSAVGYLGYHMSGTRKMPARNPTPFVHDGSGWRLADDAMQDLGSAIVNYVKHGEPDKGAV